MLFANRLPKPDSLRAAIRMDETRCVDERLAEEILRLMGSKNKVDFRPPTTARAVARTSPWREPNWDGSRRCRWRTG